MAKVRRTDDGRWMFECPACGCAHGPNDTWAFNGNVDKPTFHPSILVRYKRWITDEESARAMNGERLEIPDVVCHSFVTDGMIRFLDDCTHELAGKTVEIPDWN